MPPSRTFVVRPGDCIESIAARFGCDWHALWSHADNEVLRATRSNPNLLVPGDIVHVPGSLLAPSKITQGGSHRFRASVPQTTVKLRLVRDGDPSHPLADAPYVVRFHGVRVEGTTDGEGHLSATVPATLARAELVLGEGTPEERSIELRIGHLDPVDGARGVAQRLRNLGHLPRLAEGPQVAHAIASFQSQHGLEATGVLDEATRERLASVHGS